MMSTLSNEERESLEEWISESNENRDLFDHIISSENLFNKIDHYSDDKYQDAYAELIAVKESLPQVKKRSLKVIMKYVAVVAVLIVSLWGIYLYQSDEQKPSLQASLNRKYSVPILKLSNGEIVRFDSMSIIADKITDKSRLINRNEDEIEYPNEVASDDELSYNELIVPERCRQKIILSDKSVVWVNSNTSIRYPLMFGSTERRVFITGEALFEVTKESSRPFIVETASLSVNVTGTLFNVNAYSQQSKTIVTLMNGSVSSNVNNKEYALIPNQQLIFDKESDSTEIREVVADDYALWVEGIYVFNKMKLKDILFIIERCYGVECYLENKEYSEMEITGELNINKGVMSFVNLLSKCSDFKFSINEGSITIQ